MPDVRKVLRATLGMIPEQDVGVFLSAGIDSTSCLLALQELGYNVHAYSFSLANRTSTDIRGAAEIAATFDVPLTRMFLPTGLDYLKITCRDLVSFGAKLKTDFECAWPFLHALRSGIPQRWLVTGHGADGHFCISKKARIHYADDCDGYRDASFGRPGYGQAPVLRAIAKRYNNVFAFPYHSEAMRAEFRGTTWEQINKPKQKQSILDAYPEKFAQIKVRKHANLQLGDSGIAELFAKLVDTDWNTRQLRSPVGIYNDLVAGRI